MTLLHGVVRPGKGNAGAKFIAPHLDRWERALGSAVHPASLNVYVQGNYGRWKWGLRRFNEKSRRIECKVDGVRGFVVWLRHPGPSWNEGHDAKGFYRTATMLEIVSVEKIDGVGPNSEVCIEVDVRDLRGHRLGRRLSSRSLRRTTA